MKLAITNEEQVVTIPSGTQCSAYLDGDYRTFFLKDAITAKVAQRDNTNYNNVRRVYNQHGQHWFWVYCVEVENNATI